MALESEYVLSRGSEEYQRLRRQARIWEAATKRVFDQLEIRPGMRCLDVGCGPGETMRMLGEMVGAEGEVVGVDSDGKLGAEAVAILQRKGSARFRFVEADVTSSDFDLAERFDLTFARLFLIHMPDPQAVLQRIVDWTAPGGYVVLQDCDLSFVKIHPSLETWPDFMSVLLGAFTKRGRDPEIGSKLPSLLVNAGLEAPVQTDVAGKISSLREASGMLSSVFHSLLPQALQLGLIDEAAAARVLDEVEEQSHSDVAYTVCWPILTAAWSQKTN